MKKLTLSKAYSERGADMGRQNQLPEDEEAKMELAIERLQWVDGDYDQGGAYWGNSGGTYIYCAHGECGEDSVEIFVRATNTDDAERMVIEYLPNATFVRQGFAALDAFILAYIEAALWSTNDGSNESGGEPLDSNYSVDDIDPEALEQIIEDCKQFQEDNSRILDAAFEMGLPKGTRDGGPVSAGHDFWLTRNHHGCGFWDGGWSGTDVATGFEFSELLCLASRKFNEVNLYVGDDEKIHIG